MLLGCDSWVVLKRLSSILPISLMASIGFGIADERLTRLGGGFRGVALLANSPVTWSLWPLVLGLVVGRGWLGVLSAALGTPTALVGFYLVHGGGFGQAFTAAEGWLPTAVAAGVVIGSMGSVSHYLLGRRRAG